MYQYILHRFMYQCTGNLNSIFLLRCDVSAVQNMVQERRESNNL